MFEAIEYIVPFEIASGGYVVVRSKERGVLLAENVDDLGLRPHIELSFFAFRIGIERGAKRPLPRGHLARQPGHRLARAGGKQVVSRALISKREQLENEGVVVEHLLEMRDQPALVHGIARESAAEMVVDAALAHARQRKLDQAEVAFIVQAQAGAPEKLEHHGLRELGRAAHPAMDGIDQAGDAIGRAVELGRGDHPAALRARALGKTRHQGAAVLLHARWIVTKHPLDLAQEVDERRFSVSGGLGKIRAAPERLPVRGQKHGERPAAMLAEVVQCRHVDLIDVGAFLAVDLDVDEQLVHHARRRLILEALMRHHVAPVAGGIADG